MAKDDFIKSLDKTNADDGLYHIMLTAYYFLENHRIRSPKRLGYINRKILSSVLGDTAASYLVALIEEYEKKYGAD